MEDPTKSRANKAVTDPQSMTMSWNDSSAPVPDRRALPTVLPGLRINKPSRPRFIQQDRYADAMRHRCMQMISCKLYALPLSFMKASFCPIYNVASFRLVYGCGICTSLQHPLFVTASRLNMPFSADITSTSLISYI